MADDSNDHQWPDSERSVSRLFNRIEVEIQSRVKRVGLIGGIAPASTIEYYKLIIERWRAQVPDGGYPPIIIDSIDLQRLLALAGAKQFDELVRWLLDELTRLALAGVHFAAFASNTPHLVFDEVRERSRCRSSHRRGRRQLRHGLQPWPLGTPSRWNFLLRDVFRRATEM